MMTIEEETIEIFCRELFVALRQATCEKFDIQLELFAAPCEEDQKPNIVRNPLGVSCDSNI